MFSELSFSYESDNEWEDQPSWSDDKTQKNDEEQVFWKDPASKDSVLPTVEIIPDNNYVEWPTYCFIFPVITIIKKHADVCYNVWVSNVSNDGKQQNSNCADEGREVCIIDPALQVTQPETKESIMGILHKLLNNMLFILVRMNIRQRHIWKDIKQPRWNQLRGVDDHVKIVSIGELTIDNGEQRECFTGMPFCAFN